MNSKGNPTSPRNSQRRDSFINRVSLVLTRYGIEYPLAVFPIKLHKVTSLPSTNVVWGKVMFLHLCVILFTGVCVSQHAVGQTPLGRHPPETETEAGGTHSNGIHSCLYVWPHRYTYFPLYWDPLCSSIPAYLRLFGSAMWLILRTYSYGASSGL